jgi:hypothetical protein
MTRFASFRDAGPSSISLAALALISLSVALVSVIGPTAASIPHQLQGRVRGSNPAWSAVADGDCTDQNITSYDFYYGPPNAFRFDVPCTVTNDPCIQCAKSMSYLSQMIPSNPGIIFKLPGIVNCNGNNNGGSIGTCQVIAGKPVCDLTKGYNCYTTGIFFNNQGN